MPSLDDLIGPADEPESIETTTPEPATTEPLPISTFDRPTYAWADDVFFVYENQLATAKQAKAWSPARQGLLKLFKKDSEHYMGQLMPKAMQLLEKARDKNGDMDSVVAEEKRNIKELKKILVAAIEEAKVVE